MEITIASFDIGKHNFCVYVETFDKALLKKCTSIEQVCTLGKCVYWKNISLCSAPKGKGKVRLNATHYDNMISFLNKHDKIWQKVNYVIIEEQRKKNIDCIKLSQNCYTYFLVKYGREKCKPQFIPSSFKTQKLDALPVGLSRYKGDIHDATKIQLNKFSLKVIKDYMRELNLKLTGKKHELIQRIVEFRGFVPPKKFDAITLASYDISELREYIRETGIEGKYRTKKEIIKKIQEFHGIDEEIIVTSINRRVAIKQWSVVHAIKMLGLRGDKHGVKKLEKTKKADDLADAYNQCQAFKMGL